MRPGARRLQVVLPAQAPARRDELADPVGERLEPGQPARETRQLEVSVGVHQSRHDHGRAPVDHFGFEAALQVVPGLDPGDPPGIGNRDSGVAQEEVGFGQDVLSPMDGSDHTDAAAA